MTNPSDKPFDDANDDHIEHSYMSIGADEMDYLRSYWELRDAGQMFGWAVRLLYDLSKLDEAGWVICLQKGTYDEDTHKVTADEGYRAAAFRLKATMPAGKTAFIRLPSPKTLDRLMKVTVRKKKGKESKE